jgi:hypothetical protein
MPDALGAHYICGVFSVKGGTVGRGERQSSKIKGQSSTEGPVSSFKSGREFLEC